jgi:hypothetical protein
MKTIASAMLLILASGCGNYWDTHEGAQYPEPDPAPASSSPPVTLDRNCEYGNECACNSKKCPIN